MCGTDPKEKPAVFYARLFPALAEATLRRYLAGQVTSVLGSWTQNVTLNLLVYDLSRSAAILALLNFLLYGPQLIVAPIAGSRLSSRNARRITLFVLTASLLLTCSLFTLWMFDVLSVRLILAHALAIGIASAVETPARQVLLLTSLRDRRLVSSAVAMNTMVYNVGRMVGPSIAAVLYPKYGPAVSFAVYALALCFMACCVRTIKTSAVLRSSLQSRGLREVVSYIVSDPFAARYLPTLGCIGLFAGSYQTLVPLLADHAFHNAARFTGIFFACAGAGSLTSAILLSSSLGALASRKLIGWAPWAAVLALAILSMTNDVATSATAFYALGLSLTFAATSTNATVQRQCPEHVRGGLVGIYGMAYNGTMPFGYLLVGTVSEGLGVRGTFGAMAGVLAAGVLCIAVFHRLRRQGDEVARLSQD